MKTLLLFLAMTALFQSSNYLNLNDLDGLIGKNWSGTLTYLDYSADKQETIPTELMVSKSAKVIGTYKWVVSYPKEPSHNSIDEIMISKNGKVFDGEKVIERKVLSEGRLMFITQTNGKDNEKQAILKVTYIIGKRSFSRKKEVCYKGTPKWFTRNELSLKSE